MSQNVAVSIAGKLIARLPGLLLRLVLNPRRLTSKIKVDLRGNGPGELALGGTIPTVRLWFTLKNWSAFPVTLDRMSLQVCIEQIICTAAIVDRIDVPGPGEVEQPHFLAQLSNAQVESLRRHSTAGSCRLMIYGRAYFYCKLGWFVKDLNIERPDFPCRT